MGEDMIYNKDVVGHEDFLEGRIQNFVLTD
jgi:hypothetical protein